MWSGEGELGDCPRLGFRGLSPRLFHSKLNYWTVPQVIEGELGDCPRVIEERGRGDSP